LDILGQTQQNLNFTTPVYLLKYYKQKTDRANFEKFQQLNKSKYIGVDLSTYIGRISNPPRAQ